MSDFKTILEMRLDYTDWLNRRGVELPARLRTAAGSMVDYETVCEKHAVIGDAPFAVDKLTGLCARTRITSYNVCYTKLLRKMRPPYPSIAANHRPHQDFPAGLYRQSTHRAGRHALLCRYDRQSGRSVSHRCRWPAGRAVWSAPPGHSPSIPEVSCGQSSRTTPRITSYNVCYTKLLRIINTHTGKCGEKMFGG